MMFKRFFVLSLLLFVAGFPCFSQEEKTGNDTINNRQKDSIIYRQIEEYSEKRKITRLLHKLVFHPTRKNYNAQIRVQDFRSYEAYDGKIIRNIVIETLDPFGYSVYDTLSKPRNWAENTGNKIHKRTLKGTIRDLLLIKPNTHLDPLLVKESERLIRSQVFVRSALITAEFPQGNLKADSVDVNVRVLDSWSIIPIGAFSPTQTMLGLRERNFIGTGHEFRVRYTSRFNEGNNAYRIRYIIPNLKNTFIRTSAGYRNNLDDSFYKGINIERVFYSPFTRWAGGSYIDQQYRKDWFPDENLELSLESFKYNTYDFWGGHSYNIFKGNTEDDRTTNLITSARMLRVDFKEPPPVEFDEAGFFSSETFFLGSVGIASRQFIKDQYIFNYGIVEDVPVGTIYGLTGGYQQKNNEGRLYFGSRVAYGKYFGWGFISTNMEIGTFINNKKPEQTTYSFQANFFTNLIELGPAWKMRQFVKPQFVWGENRLNTIGDRLSLNDRGNFLGLYGADFEEQEVMGIQGFRSTLYGTQKFLLTLQTQFYAPWNLWGFRLNPFLNYSLAMIGDEIKPISRSKMYSSIGAGVIISNDYLVFETFQLSFALFPEIPGVGTNVFRTNSFHTSDFGLQEFDFGKPRTVFYK